LEQVVGALVPAVLGAADRAVLRAALNTNAHEGRVDYPRFLHRLLRLTDGRGHASEQRELRTPPREPLPPARSSREGYAAEVARIGAAMADQDASSPMVSELQAERARRAARQGHEQTALATACLDSVAGLAAQAARAARGGGAGGTRAAQQQDCGAGEAPPATSAPQPPPDDELATLRGAQRTRESTRATPVSRQLRPSLRAAARCEQTLRLNSLLLSQQQEPIERSQLRAALHARDSVQHGRLHHGFTRWVICSAQLAAAAQVAEMALLLEEQDEKVAFLQASLERAQQQQQQLRGDGTDGGGPPSTPPSRPRSRAGSVSSAIADAEALDEAIQNIDAEVRG
jgi:hypothetical protein